MKPSSLARTLDEVRATCDVRARLDVDPVGFVRRYEDRVTR